MKLGKVGGFGGGGLTALSSQVLGNSDFLTGTFPVEYGNALSGVFDIKLRNGNNSSWEHTVSVVTMGMDIASEGPFKKNGKFLIIDIRHYSSCHPFSLMELVICVIRIFLSN